MTQGVAVVLTEFQRKKIEELRGEGLTLIEIADRFSVGKHAIRRALRGEIPRKGYNPTTGSGRHNFVDMIGVRVGRLVVTGLAPQSFKKSKRDWVCMCDCGTEHIVNGQYLRAQSIRSCGCLLREALKFPNSQRARLDV